MQTLVPRQGCMLFKTLVPAARVKPPSASLLSLDPLSALGGGRRILEAAGESMLHNGASG